MIELIFFPELIIFHYHISGYEDQSIIQLPDAFEALHSFHFHHLAPGLNVPSVQYCFLSRFQHTRYLWQNTKITDKSADVSWLPFLRILIT